MKLLRFNESIEQDNIRDYFTDFIDDDFTFSITKSYLDERGFNQRSYPFNGCEYIQHSIDIILTKSNEYKNYHDDFVKAVNRCCDSEGLEIKNYNIEHFFGGTHNYHFKCSLKEPFEEEVDEPTQFMNDFINFLKERMRSKTANSSFSQDDIIIENKGDKVIIRSTGGIDTASKFKTLSNWIKEIGGSTWGRSSHYNFNVKVQIPRFENGAMVRPGILTLSEIVFKPNRR